MSSGHQQEFIYVLLNKSFFLSEYSVTWCYFVMWRPAEQLPFLAVIKTMFGVEVEAGGAEETPGVNRKRGQR